MPKPPTPTRLAKLMRQLRREQGMNTAEAGAALGLSGRTVENIEQGRGFNSPRVLELALERLIATCNNS